MTDDGDEKDGKGAWREAWRADRPYIIAILAVLVIALACIPLWYLVIKPRVEAPKSDVQYSVARQTHQWRQTKLSEKLGDEANVNPTQYTQVDANGKALECIGFVGVKNGATASTKHQVKSVLSFGDVKSRNYLLQQYPPLRMGLKTGRISVSFCFVQTDNEFSTLALEALSEADYNAPSKTWNVLYDLMLTDSSTLKTTDQRISAILSVLDKDGVAKVAGRPQITEKSILNGSFYQWAYSMSSSQRVDYLPAVYIDSSVVNDSLSIYNPDAVWKRIRAFPAS